MKPRRQKKNPPLDLHRHQRLPDHFCCPFALPKIAASALSFDVDPLGNGVIQSAKVVLPRKMIVSRGILWATGQFVLFDLFGNLVTPQSYVIETYRARNSASEKPKLLSAVPGIPGVLTTNPDELFGWHDKFLAIDTNTKPEELVDGEVLSVTGIATARNLRLPYPQAVEVSGVHAVEFRNLRGEPEKVGWKTGIELAFDQGWITPTEKVAIIVDSAENELTAINGGADLLPGWKLPSNCTIMYASADSGQDYAVNKCIRVAHRVSNDVECEIRNGRAGTVGFTAAMTADSCYDRTRVVRLNMSPDPKIRPKRP